MRQLKKVAALSMVAAMTATVFAGCGSDSKSSTASKGESKPASTVESTTESTPESTVASTAESTPESTPETTIDPTKDSGKVLNIYCWNSEFSERFMLYPGYEPADEKDGLAGGKIGDVTVKFTQINNDDGAYQTALDAALEKQATASDDEKIDIFLVEADYALKYVDTEDTLDVMELGLTEDDLAGQFKYTQDVMTDRDGVLKGVSWQGCPGVLFYNRDVAKEVLGTEDPNEVQEYVKDWATFNETAKKMVEAGYLMESSVNDSYRVYSNNVKSAWVNQDKITIDPNIKTWVDDSKALYDAKATTNDALWDGYANSKFGGCFCSFGPAWLINFSFGYDAEGMEKGTADMKNVANAGRWGATVGPQSFFWGGTWMCACAGTDNANLVADVMLKLTCDDEIMKQIVVKYDDFVNNKPAMEEMAADTSYSSYILGGQNPLGMYLEAAKGIDLSNITIYDQGCNEEFQTAMQAYFEGTSTYDEAIEVFYAAVEKRYENLTH